MVPHGSSGCSHKLRQSSHAVGSCGNFFRSPFFPLSTAKGRCLQQLLAVHFDSRHRDRPMSSRLLFALSGTMRVPVAVLVPGWLSPSLSRRDRTWCLRPNRADSVELSQRCRWSQELLWTGRDHSIFIPTDPKPSQVFSPFGFLILG